MNYWSSFKINKNGNNQLNYNMLDLIKSLLLFIGKHKEIKKNLFKQLFRHIFETKKKLFRNKKKMIENLKERQKVILRCLYEGKESSVSELSKKLNVSVVTIRKDLDKLEKKGFAVKMHGGAQPVYNRTIIERMALMSEEKQRIAKKAAELIHDGDRVIILAGTTSSLIGKYLYNKHDVHVVTNSSYLLNYVRNNPNIKVTLVGGEFVPDAEAMVGAIALRELENFSVKLSFIGSDGFSLQNGITANHVEVAEVAKKVVERSESTILVSDSSKFNRSGFAFIEELNKVDTIITDDKLPKEGFETICKNKIDIVIA